MESTGTQLQISGRAIDAMCGELGMTKLLLTDARISLEAKEAQIKALADEVMRLKAQVAEHDQIAPAVKSLDGVRMRRTAKTDEPGEAVQHA